MTSLICFYEKDLFIFSTAYEVHACPDSVSVHEFLKSFEIEAFKKLKIVQLNFEYDQTEAYSAQQALYQSAKAHVVILLDYELKTLAQLRRVSSFKPTSFKPLVSQSEFTKAVSEIQYEISQGRLYQVNLTAPLISLTLATALDLFFYYEKLFISDYKALLPLKNFELISFSPELFLQSSQGELTTQPIKGSSGAEKDFSRSLYKNKKEEAELSMIVDLLRNDLNSLGEDSAVVTKHREEMQLGYIQHTYSEIKVKNQKPLSDVLHKTMPGGSISGCPKPESLKVIRQFEKYRRQAYTGTLGWWKENDFKLNLTIRSFIKQNEKLIYHAGCGIVYDSDPQMEWNEFLLKTGSLHVEQ